MRDARPVVAFAGSAVRNAVADAATNGNAIARAGPAEDRYSPGTMLHAKPFTDSGRNGDTVSKRITRHVGQTIVNSIGETLSNPIADCLSIALITSLADGDSKTHTDADAQAVTLHPSKNKRGAAIWRLFF